MDRRLEPAERAPVIAEYLAVAARRGSATSAARQAKWYFGLEPLPSIEQIESVAAYSPVFRVEYRDRR